MRFINHRYEALLNRHLDLVVFAVIGIGFLLRILAAKTSYLNPDEAMHFLLANQSDLVEVYRQTLTNAHPPLFFFLLYFWQFLGNSEFVLRMLPVFAGTLALWVAHKWLRRTFGEAAAFIGVVLLSFSPTMVSMSAEVRGYPFQLLFMLSALQFLERACEERSQLMTVLFSLFLCLAILTHYSTLWVSLALGVYFVVCAFSRKLPAEVVKIWLWCQVSLASVGAVLFVTHIQTLRGSAMEQEAINSWLRNSYFQADEEAFLFFVAKGSIGLFAYLFASLWVGIAFLLLFLMGAGLLLARGAGGRQRQACRWDLGFLVLLPIVVACTVGILAVYPYGATRHSIYIVPFIVAGVSVALAMLVGGRLRTIVVAAIATVPLWNLYGVRYGQLIVPAYQRRDLMGNALNYIRQSVRRGAVLFVDGQTSLLLAYYLGRDQTTQFGVTTPDFLTLSYGGYQVVSTGTARWRFTAESFVSELKRMARIYGLNPEEPIWVMNAGWGKNLAVELTRRFPRIDLHGLRTFGDNISIFKISPASLSGK